MVIEKEKVLVFYIFGTLLLLGVIPSFLHSMKYTGSLTTGVFIFTLILFPVWIKYIYAIKYIPTRLFITMSLFVSILSLQSLIAITLSEKSYYSFALMGYILSVSYFLSISINGVSNKTLYSALKLLTCTLFFIALFNIITGNVLSFLYHNSKSVFPFGEPSHFALFAGIFFLMLFIIFDNVMKKSVIFFATCSLGVLFPSVTMICYALLMLLVSIKFRFVNVLLISVVVLLSLYKLSLTSYFTDRINFSENSQNLSTLVYLQGVDYAKKSIVSTMGAGTGFQMMGSQPPSNISKNISFILNDPTGNGLNREDGGFLAAKIVTEFGFFGVFLLIVFLNFFRKSFVFLRSIPYEYTTKIKNIKLIAAHSVVFSFSIEIFVRGAGYFTPSAFIFYVSVFYIFTHRDKS